MRGFNSLPRYQFRVMKKPRRDGSEVWDARSSRRNKIKNMIMKNESEIAWTDFTLNPWIGCTWVSPACLNCYAAAYGKRFGVEFGQGKPRRQTAKWMPFIRTLNERVYRCMKCGVWVSQAQADQHIKTCCKDPQFLFPRRPTVFCGSLMDVFDAEVDPAWREQLFRIIAECMNLTFLLLTKRPHLAKAFLERLPDWPWDHVAVGTTAENQDWWDRRMPILMSTPAKLRFVSVEPMLSPITLRGAEPDWIIIGGESGPKARQTDTEWIRALLAEIKGTIPKTRVMVKQLGANPTCSKITRGDFRYFEEIRHKAGGNPAEWPPDLKVQQVIRQLHDDLWITKDLITDPD